jgi:hypothetical protein
MRTTSGESAWAECESVIRQFEGAWREHQRPDVGEYLTPGSPHSVQLLVELVHVDLEFRLRAGECARAEEYFDRFPELCPEDLALDLILAECALRNRYTAPAWPEEYWLRFPEHADELRSRLPATGGTGWSAVTRAAELTGAPLPGPETIADYEILGELGRGGMGVVYRARDRVLHRTVAVKTFATVPRPDSCARFAREAEAIARLDHPNIVPVYEVGTWTAPGGPAVPFFVMKWYPGGSLDAAPSGPGTDPKVHARTVETIARAVHHAHQRGVLHRDLKPSNILLDDDQRPHVADFGLAGRVDPDAPTVTEVVVGTPAYMAPEQARSPRQVSTAADVYGLGAILYHQLTGAAPFEGETPLATLDMVASDPPARPSAVNRAVPRDLDTICLKCLEKDPARRYASAAELADDLERWRTGLPIAARPARALELAWRRTRRHPLVTALACTTAAALVGAVAVLADSNERISEKEKEMRAAYLRECAMRYRLEETLAREQQTRSTMEEALRHERREVYLARVAGAGRLVAARQFDEARALLGECAEPFRGWEWRYLDSVVRSDGGVLGAPDGPGVQLVFLADGRAVRADAEGYLRVRTGAAPNGERVWVAARSPVTALSAHPSKCWASVATASEVTVWDVEREWAVARLTGAGWVCFSPDGTLAATADRGAVRIWAVPHREPVIALRGTGPGVVPVWEPVGELIGHEGPISAGAFSPDGTRLAVVASDGVAVWDLRTRARVAWGEGLPGGCAVAYSADGRWVATADTDQVVRLRDAANGTEVRRLIGGPMRVNVLCFGPDCTRLATGGADRTVRVWDVETGRELLTLPGASAAIGALVWDPKTELISALDSGVRVWGPRP